MKKLKIFIVIAILITAGISILSFRKSDYYNKNHYSFYKNPSTFGNGSNGIIITFKNWKIIPHDKNTDIILWKAIFKNNSSQQRRILATSYFRDESFMNLSEQDSTDNGKIIQPNSYRTYNGKNIVPKSISERIKDMNIAISSQYPVVQNGKTIWQTDRI